MIPGLTETIIREHTTRQTYARGREYFEQGAVLSLARRGRAIKAEVEGNEYAPYLVRIDFDAGGVTRARPVTTHTVSPDTNATNTLAAINSTKEIETRRDDLLAD